MKTGSSPIGRAAEPHEAGHQRGGAGPAGAQPPRLSPLRAAARTRTARCWGDLGSGQRSSWACAAVGLALAAVPRRHPRDRGRHPARPHGCSGQPGWSKGAAVRCDAKAVVQQHHPGCAEPQRQFQIGLEITSLPVPGVITALGPAGGSLSATPPAARAVGRLAGRIGASAGPSGRQPAPAPAGATITARTRCRHRLEGIASRHQRAGAHRPACKDWGRRLDSPAPHRRRSDGACMTLRRFDRHRQQSARAGAAGSQCAGRGPDPRVWQQLGGRWGGTAAGRGSATGDLAAAGAAVRAPGEVRCGRC